MIDNEKLKNTLGEQLAVNKGNINLRIHLVKNRLKYFDFLKCEIYKNKQFYCFDYGYLYFVVDYYFI